ncbi:MAG: hypothetical protein IT364_19475 [Candidatus Hydrogenedentes bacterium]|nr:hypothetical protein [Candidatus Hydrogenedentota bacterium]
MEYHVTWTIDLDAESPEDAARKALRIHRDPDSWATHFEVRDAQGNTCEVDLGFPGPNELQARVFVLIPLEDGMVGDVSVFANAACAQRAEQEWLAAHDLTDENKREHASDWGTGIAIWECDLKPRIPA